MAKITVNGKEYEAQEGATLLKELTRLGIEVPFYCYHHKLSIAANCRMCLIELEGAPKLQPACQLTVREGMTIQTESEKVLEARRSVMEFLLVNHPIDCPVCDQSGECWLQDYYMLHARHKSRVPQDFKVRREKAIKIGPMIYLDRERCIQCSRCVRFLDEVAKNPQLELVGRGDHTYIEVAKGKEVDDPYSGNVFEICPVGALTSADFRFKMRVWWLQSTDSICAGCAKGCNIRLQYNRDTVSRYLSRENEEVNQCWLCDEGRLSYRELNEGFAWNAAIKGGKATASETLTHAVNFLKPYLHKEAEKKVLLAVSAQQSNEEAYLAGAIFKQLFGADKALIIGKPEGSGDKFLKMADKNPNRRGVKKALEGLGYKPIDIEEASALISKNSVETVFCLGSHIESEAAVEKLLAAQTVIVFTPYKTPLAERASLLIPIGTFAETEGTFINGDGRLQLFRRAFWPRGEAREGWKALIALAEGLGLSLKYGGAAEIFVEMSKRLPGFEGLSYGKIGALGVKI